MHNKADSHDIVIYGATSTGIVAAVQCARMNKSCIIVEPYAHIGGMTTGGLGVTDYGIAEAIGGLALTFYKRILEHYGDDSAWGFQSREGFLDYLEGRGLDHKDNPMWHFEPHVAARVFQGLVEEHDIELALNERLDLCDGVIAESNEIIAIKAESGKEYHGRVFIDATYEGDLMALAGVSYHVGRESADTYGESLAGVLPYRDPALTQPKKFFGKSVSPYGKNGNLLFGIQDVPMGEPGQGDRKVQAYNFRLCLTTHPENQIPITRPVDYDASRYELLARYIATTSDIGFVHKGDRHPGVLGVHYVPNAKTDINDGSPFSTDYVGANWDYPEGDYETRRHIWDDHYSYTRGLLYFLAHDERVPKRIRKEMRRFGYPKDEFIDTDHFTPQLYIREARRMVGEYVMTQADCEVNRTKPTAIGVGSYAPDSHHVQRIVTRDGEVINEGNFWRDHRVYEIPMETLLPKREECRNLLVPVCVSSSHIAFGSLRMEPVFMIMAQSAATIACLSLESNVAVHDLAYEAVRDALLEHGQILGIDGLT